MRINFPTLRTLCVLALASAPLACNSEEGGGRPMEDPDQEACEHMEEGPMVDVAASAMSSATAPKINSDHKRYDISLVDVMGAKGGFVTFAAPSEGDYILYTGAPVQLEVKSAAGVKVMAESSAASISQCMLVKGKHVYELKVGTHVIGISGALVDKVSFVVEGSHAHSP